MPRPSNTYERVFQAADQLLEQGVRPTQQKIREQLGSGSISTINKALGDWWQQLGQRMKDQRSVPGLPEPVADVAHKFWQQALGYAERSFREQSEQYAAQLQAQSNEVQQQAREAIQQAEVLRAHNERLMQENELLMTERRDRDDQVRELESSVISLTGQNADLQRELKQQGILLKNNEIYPASNPDDEEELIQLKVELRVRERNLEQQASRIAQLEAENARLTQQCYDAEQDALKRQHGLELVIAQQDVRYEEAQRQLRHYQAGGELVDTDLNKV